MGSGCACQPDQGAQSLLRAGQRAEQNFQHKNINQKLNSANSQLIVKKGKRFRGELIVLIALKTDEPGKMLAVVSKKIGNSVTRHKIKRQLRAMFRESVDVRNPKLSYAFIAKPAIFQKPYSIIQNEYTKLLKDASHENTID